VLMSTAISLAPILPEYNHLRECHPYTPALLVFRYLRDNEGLTFEQFVCAHTTGHFWSHTGTAYGGDDDGYHGEGRAYCSSCGADGDS